MSRVIITTRYRPLVEKQSMHYLSLDFSSSKQLSNARWLLIKENIIIMNNINFI